MMRGHAERGLGNHQSIAHLFASSTPIYTLFGVHIGQLQSVLKHYQNLKRLQCTPTWNTFRHVEDLRRPYVHLIMLLVSALDQQC